VVKSLALLGNRAEWERMSREAAADVRERFRVERVVPRYEALYERVLAGRGRPAPTEHRQPA
jgi:glycosyltransferase involved in cell wall biosynthesis